MLYKGITDLDDEFDEPQDQIKCLKQITSKMRDLQGSSNHEGNFHGIFDLFDLTN